MPGGRVAILMVDIRGSRSFYHEDGAQHYFGSKQWTFIKVSLHMARRIHSVRALSHSLLVARVASLAAQDSLASDGTLSNVRTLITVSTGAVILLGSSCSK